MVFSEEEFIGKNITVGYKNFSVLSKGLNFESQIHVSSKHVKKWLNFEIIKGELLKTIHFIRMPNLVIVFKLSRNLNIQFVAGEIFHLFKL